MFLMMIAATEDENCRAFLLHVYQQYYNLVRKTVYAITHDPAIVEDLVNDTFIRLMEKADLLSQFDSCRLTAYVVYSARSVAINFIKRRDVERKHIVQGKEADLAESMAADSDGQILDDVIVKEDAERLKAAILRLPQEQRDVLYFKYFLELSDAEIAGALGIAPNSVRTYLTRARRAAKKQLQEGVSS